MQRNLTRQFYELFEKSDEFKRQLGNYDRLLKTPEFKFFKDMLLMMTGVMANDMFSRTYTELDKEEKEAIQRTYYNINQILTFLANPLGEIQKAGKWKQLATNLKMRANPNPKREGK